LGHTRGVYRNLGSAWISVTKLATPPVANSIEPRFERADEVALYSVKLRGINGGVPNLAVALVTMQPVSKGWMPFPAGIVLPKATVQPPGLTDVDPIDVAGQPVNKLALRIGINPRHGGRQQRRELDAPGAAPAQIY
jgi:hypothetical protein